ncbi:MAG TPA: S1C family serine protease [Phenylobacterium sp.]
MKWFKVALALCMLSAPSYARSATPEELIGAPTPAGKSAGAGRTSGVTVPSSLARAAWGAKNNPGLARYSKSLGALQPEGQSSLRGAKESAVYQQASPSVVLVVTADGGLGSGVLVSADGRIVTNYHVVGGASEVGVIFKPAVEGAKVGKDDLRLAKVIKVDEIADLALIQVEQTPPGSKPLAIGDNGSVSVGADVHAIGHPQGETWTYTRGIVSQVRRDFEWTAQEETIKHKATVIQTQTPINPGNSGGPLINDALQVVGINTFVGDGEGLNYAVSGDDVRAFLARSGDRVESQPKSASKAKGPDGSCQSKILESWDETEPFKGEAGLVDFDCDGKGDVIMLAPLKKSDPVLMMFDDNGDGEIDTILYDENHDGDPETALYDTDFDQKPDMVGYYKKGESEPFRFERYTPKG